MTPDDPPKPLRGRYLGVVVVTDDPPTKSNQTDQIQYNAWTGITVGPMPEPETKE